MIVSIFAFWGCQKGINLDDVSIPNRSSQTNLAIQIAEEVGIMHNEGLDYCYSKLNAINNIEFVFEDSLKMLLDREIKLYADSYIASKRYDFSDVFCSNIDNNISVTLNKVFNDSLPTLIFQNRVQAMYYDSIISIVENELLSYNDVLLYLNTLKENVINNFSNQEDLLAVLVGIEVAKNSYIYWYNDVKWKSLFADLKSSSDRKWFDWGNVWDGDIAGAVGGAIGGLPGGLPGVGTGALLGGIGGSAGMAVIQVIHHWI